MNISDHLTPTQAVGRLVSELAASELIRRVDPHSEHLLASSQTMCCIAALMEHPNQAELHIGLFGVDIETFMPHDLDGYIRTLIDVCFDTAKEPAR